jgi:hypothetical protein
VLPVLALAALAVLPANAPLADLPPGADPCIALTPAVVDQLRTSGALTPLVPDEIPTSTRIVTGRSLTGCAPTSDPDSATIRTHVCPLLTAEGVDTLATDFGATSAVRADLGPERIAIARNALRCDHPATTASEVATAGQGAPAAKSSADRDSSNTANRADRRVLEEPNVTSLTALAALIGILLLLAVMRPPKRQSAGGGGTSRHVEVLRPPPGATELGQQRIPDARDTSEGQQQSTPGDGSDLIGQPGNRPESYDELLERLRREVTELQRAHESTRERPTRSDDQGEH